MSYEQLVDRARRVVALAQEEARERGAPEVGTEHVLLGLVREPRNLGHQVIAAHSVTPEAVRSAVDAPGTRGPGGSTDDPSAATPRIDLDLVDQQTADTLGPGAPDRTRSADDRQRQAPPGLPPVDRAVDAAFEMAMLETTRMGTAYVGCEHLLLGLLHGGEAARVLAGLGITLDSARASLEELLSSSYRHQG